MERPHYISNQDIFDAAWQAFVVERRPPSIEKHTAAGYSPACCYRGNGTRCAIGLCIPDEVYIDQMEGQTAESIAEQFSDLLEFEDEFVATSLQRGLHDMITDRLGDVDPEFVERQYRNLAERYNLTIPGEAQ